jgi:hypothetical protein
MKTLIALALGAALVTPAMSARSDYYGQNYHGRSNYGRTSTCTVFTPRDTLNVRSLPDGKVIVNEFADRTTVTVLDTKLVNGHPWVFATGGPETNPTAGWVHAGFLTHCTPDPV